MKERSTFQANTMSPRYYFLTCQGPLLKPILHKFVYKSSKSYKVSFEKHLLACVVELLGGVVALEHGNHVLAYHET